MQLKSSKMLPYHIPFQWLSFGRLAPDPTTVQAPTVLPYDSHSHWSAKRLFCGYRDARLKQTQLKVNPKVIWFNPLILLHRWKLRSREVTLFTQSNTASHGSLLISNALLFSQARSSLTNNIRPHPPQMAGGTRPFKKNNRVITLLLSFHMIHLSPFHIVAFVLSVSCRKMTYCLEIQLGIFFRQSDLLNVANISFGV